MHQNYNDELGISTPMNINIHATRLCWSGATFFTFKIYSVYSAAKAMQYILDYRVDVN
jgi:hypothetical protein